MHVSFAYSNNEYKVELLNENNGFVSSIIFSIVQDKDGFLWFGTAYDGVMRYDGKNIVRFLHEPNNSNSLVHNNAGNLSIDSKNNLWVGSWGGGLTKLEIQTNTFSRYEYNENQNEGISGNKIKDIFEDQSGGIWLGTGSSGLNRFGNSHQKTIHYPFNDKLNEFDGNSSSHGRIWDLAQTTEDSIWIATHNGLNHFDKVNNKFKYLNLPSELNNKEHKKTRQLLVTENNNLLIGTDDGVLLFEPKTASYSKLKIKDYSSIGPIYSMIKTNFNEFWVTSNRGVFSFTLDSLTLKKVNLGVNDHCSQTLFQGMQGVIWLSCEGVGVYKIIKQNTFKRFELPNMISAYSLLATEKNNLLIGTAKSGIQEWNTATNQLLALNPIQENRSQLDIWDLTQTSQGDIWFINSLNLFSFKKGQSQKQFVPPASFKYAKEFKGFKHITTDIHNNIWLCTKDNLFVIRDSNGEIEKISLGKSFQHKVSSAFFQDANNRLWIGGTDRILVWDDKTKTSKQFQISNLQNPNLPTNNYFYALHQDKQQRMWASTPQGLYLFDEKNSRFSLYSDVFVEAKNLGVRFIKEDRLGYIWLFTPLGVSQLNPKDGQIEHFNKTDGLSGTRYFTFDVAQLPNGLIFFSSRDGVHYFEPTSIKERQIDAKTLLTDFEILGTPNTNKTTSLGGTNLELDYDQNYFKFEFSTLDLHNARQIQYEYKLEGFDKDWIKNGHNNSTVYTNLSGGEYLFKVRSSLKNGVYYDDELQVRVFIATPFWKQWWMLIFYAVLISLWIFYYIQQQKKSVLKLEKQVAEKTASIEQKSNKLEAANKVKSQFLANMSHEIRTPLTTVIGQAEAIICRDIDSADIYKEVAVIHDSGLYLLSLLNDILDLTKIEQNKFGIALQSQDVHELLENIDRMFSIQAKRKGLPFKLTKHLPATFIVKMDSLRVKQILVNLCSNAIKFTPEGFVTLDVFVKTNQLIFTLTDTGIGLDANQSEQAFESFTQGDADISRRFGGTGLGLSLSRGLAELMKGKIIVKSQLNKGSTFTFSLPVEILKSSDSQITNTSENGVTISEKLFNGKVLLAEDHPDNSRLLSRLLSKLGLTVYTAVDGQEAIEQCNKHDPDAILMDIQMPNMDGIEAFQILRKRNYQKPIIALTANAMSHEIEQYLALGFNDHLSKPLDRQILIATIAKYFENQVPEAIGEADKALNSVDMTDLIAQFKINLLEDVELFKQYSNNLDMQSLAKQTHRLIGASQLFGFQKLAEIAVELETCIKANDQKNTEILVKKLLEEITSLTS